MRISTLFLSFVLIATTNVALAASGPKKSNCATVTAALRRSMSFEPQQSVDASKAYSFQIKNMQKFQTFLETKLLKVLKKAAKTQQKVTFTLDMLNSRKALPKITGDNKLSMNWAAVFVGDAPSPWVVELRNFCLEQNIEFQFIEVAMGGTNSTDPRGDARRSFDFDYEHWNWNKWSVADHMVPNYWTKYELQFSWK